MEESSKITTEDEEKLIVVKGYLGRLQQKISLDPLINETKNILIGQLDTSILNVALTVKTLKSLEDDIEFIMNSESFEDDELTLIFRQYLMQIKNYMILKEQQLKLVVDSYIKTLEQTNNLTKPTTRFMYIKEDQELMTELEREDLNSMTRRYGLAYKQYKNNSKMLEANIYLEKLDMLANTNEKLVFMDDILHEITNEYLLSTRRTSEQRKQRKNQQEKEIIQEIKESPSLFINEKEVAKN